MKISPKLSNLYRTPMYISNTLGMQYRANVNFPYLYKSLSKMWILIVHHCPPDMSLFLWIVVDSSSSSVKCDLFRKFSALI